MLKKLFAVLVIIVGVAGLVLPVIPGIVLITLGISLLFGYEFKLKK